MTIQDTKTYAEENNLDEYTLKHVLVKLERMDQSGPLRGVDNFKLAWRYGIQDTMVMIKNWMKPK